jgi:hypothetical protein
MKYFFSRTNETRGFQSEKHNFVDDNNVFVGYDATQDCCESADWAIFDSEIYDPINSECTGESDLPDYNFDSNYFKEWNPESCDEGGAVLFRLTKKDAPDKYLCLWNHQNGYYGHGFEVKHGGTIIHDGVL